MIFFFTVKSKQIIEVLDLVRGQEFKLRFLLFKFFWDDNRFIDRELIFIRAIWKRRMRSQFNFLSKTSWSIDIDIRLLERLWVLSWSYLLYIKFIFEKVQIHDDLLNFLFFASLVNIFLVLYLVCLLFSCIVRFECLIWLSSQRV